MSQSTEIKYSVADTSTFKELVQFHNNYFGNIRPLNVWEWQYGKSNPFKSVLIVGVANNRIIASQGAFGIDLTINGKIYQTGKNESLLIEPEYRKKGVYSELYDFAFEEYKKAGFNFIWGFTKAEGPFVKVGFSFDRIVERAILPLSYKKALKIAKVEKLSIIKSLIIMVGTFFSSIYSIVLFELKTKKGNRGKAFEICFEQRNENDLLNFYSKIDKSDKELIHINFTKDFLDWRIKKSPQRIATIFSYRNNELLGYLFVEIGREYTDVVDFMYIEEPVGNALMAELYNLVKKETIKFLSYSGNKFNKLNIKVFNFLKKFGFIKIKGPNGFVLKKLHETNSSLELKNWYITSIWYEGI